MAGRLMVYARMGWTAAERAAFEATLRGPHRTRSRIELRNFEHAHIGTLTSARMSGSVQVQADSDGATRSASVELFDPTNMLGLGVGETSVRPDRMLQIWRGAYVESLGRWFDVPVFCGPLTKPSRTGDLLTIEAQDKSALADSNATTFTLRKGENAITALRRLMVAIGETRFRLTSTSKRLGYDRVLSADLTPWQAAQSIAKGLGWVLFYDGGGYLVCQPRPTASQYTFRAGPGGSMTSQPQRGFWDNEIVNRVHVTGGTVAGVVIKAHATVDARNAFSPEYLGRHGKVRRKAEYIEDTSIMTTSDAKARAARRVKELAVQESTSSFEALACAYHLEEHDVYTAVDPTTGERTKTAVREMTIPLGHEGTQAMGYAARTPRTRLGTRSRTNQHQISQKIARQRAQKRARLAKEAKRKALAKKARR